MDYQKYCMVSKENLSFSQKLANTHLMESFKDFSKITFGQEVVKTVKAYGVNKAEQQKGISKTALAITNSTNLIENHLN